MAKPCDGLHRYVADQLEGGTCTCTDATCAWCVVYYSDGVEFEEYQQVLKDKDIMSTIKHHEEG